MRVAGTAGVEDHQGRLSGVVAAPGSRAVGARSASAAAVMAVRVEVAAADLIFASWVMNAMRSAGAARR